MAKDKRKSSATSRKFVVVLIEDPEEGGYTVEVPELPGCFTEGDTPEEALLNAREAIACCLDPVKPSPSRKVRFEEIEV